MTKHGLHVVQPEGWPTARGFAYGIVAEGRAVYIAGQIGCDARGEFPRSDFVGQFAQALDNVLGILSTANGKPEYISQMTVYVTDMQMYLSSLRALGTEWRARFGKHYPAMALVGVTALVEPHALVEIQAIATLPEHIE